MQLWQVVPRAGWSAWQQLCWVADSPWERWGHLAVGGLRPHRAALAQVGGHSIPGRGWSCHTLVVQPLWGCLLLCHRTHTGRAGGFPQHCSWHSRVVWCSWFSPADRPQEVPTATPAALATTVCCSRAKQVPPAPRDNSHSLPQHYTFPQAPRETSGNTSVLSSTTCCSLAWLQPSPDTFLQKAVLWTSCCPWFWL